MSNTELRVDYQRAEDLALALNEARIDPNEAQKALAYLRSRGRGQALFEYLGAAVKDGRAVVRSNRTLGYYRDILIACERHLRPLQRDYELMVRTYALALRLLRYYRAVPGREQVRLDQLPAAPAIGESSAATSTPTVAAESAPTPVATPPRPTGPELPAIGEMKTYKILEVDDESGVALEIPGFPVAKALGVIKAADVGKKRYRSGNAARVEVLGVRTLKNGRVIVDLRPAPSE